MIDLGTAVQKVKVILILNANYSQIGQSAELLSVSQIRIEFYGKVKFMNDLQKKGNQNNCFCMLQII